MDQDEQQILRPGYVPHEKAHPQCQMPGHVIHHGGRLPGIKCHVPDEPKDLGNLFGAIATGRPISEHVIAGQGGDKGTRCFIQLVLFQQALDPLDPLLEQVHHCLPFDLFLPP